MEALLHPQNREKTAELMGSMYLTTYCLGPPSKSHKISEVIKENIMKMRLSNIRPKEVFCHQVGNSEGGSLISSLGDTHRDLKDTVTDFIGVLVNLADKATTHQFIVKAQS